MNKKVKQVKLLRKEERNFIDGKLTFKQVNEQYNIHNCDEEFFLEDIKGDMEIIKNDAEQILCCSDTEIHVINSCGWYEIVKFEIIYEGGKNNE